MCNTAEAGMPRSGHAGGSEISGDHKDLKCNDFALPSAHKKQPPLRASDIAISFLMTVLHN